jgi:membrane protease YdiL (CAAX protease family)
MNGDAHAEEPALPLSPPQVAIRNGGSLGLTRGGALLEVLLCSGYPTQLALGALFAGLGYSAQGANGLSVSYVAALSLLDSVVLIGLIVTLLLAHGERPANVFLGRRPIRPEILLGLPLAIGALALALIVLVPIRQFVPWLHTVEHNPLQDLIRTPQDIALFALIVIVAGGLREELQRAFLLHRFEQRLGGARLGAVLTSISFGAGHLLQGADAAIATACLGGYWAIVYLRRRSSVAPIVSHASFNLVQLAQFIGTVP